MVAPMKITESTLEAVNDGLPDLFEELNRKTLDAALALVSDYEQDNLSKAQFYTGFNTMFNIVSGLVSSDIMKYAFEGTKMVEKFSDKSFCNVKTYFKKASGIIVIKAPYGDKKIIMTVYDQYGDIRDEKHVSREKMIALLAQLTKLGYKELI